MDGFDEIRITLPPEAERHGDYAEVTVVADDSSQARVKRNRMTNPLLTLYENGIIDADQFDASTEIARIAEEITRPVGLRSASLEARVDNSGSAKNLLIENLSRVQLEATYNSWRYKLPMPRRMIVDMIVEQRPLAATSRIYRVGYRKARSRLIDALNEWIRIREEIRKAIDERDLAAAQFRAGGGIIE